MTPVPRREERKKKRERENYERNIYYSRALLLFCDYLKRDVGRIKCS